MNIVDTVLLDTKEGLNYVVTDINGHIAQKPKQFLTLSGIHDEFITIGKSLQGEDAKIVATGYRYGSSSSAIIDLTQFKSITLESASNPYQVLQCFIPSKGSSIHYRTYRTTFRLDKSVPQLKTDRLDLSSEVSGSSNVKSVTNMSRAANKAMESTCQLVIVLLEKNRGCRVTKATFEFVQDYNGKIWLLGTTSCQVAVNTGEAPRPTSPLDFKLVRAIQIADMQRATRAEREREEGEKGNKGRHRVSKARIVEGAPPTGRLSPYGRFSPFTGTRVEVPDARLGNEVSGLANNPAILGSTQLSSVCKGDFCSYNLATLDNIDVRDGHVNNYDKLSAFRRGLMSPDKETDKIDPSPSLTSLSGKRDSPGPDRISKPNRGIALGAIIQARQEIPLVEEQLKRHRTREPGEYVNTLGQLDADSVSGKLPSHYYQEVPVCEACYLVSEVYPLIFLLTFTSYLSS
jgi:hypothetical protein